MILAKLKEYADTQMQLPPEMYKPTAIRWYVNLKLNGELESFTPLGGDKNSRNGIELDMPYGDRTGSTIRPVLLADTGEYVLGIVRKKDGDIT